MTRSTIDFGIDLGTTNSCIAVLGGTETEIIENNENEKLTPSAVWIDRKARIHVGQRARNRLVDDPGNAYTEFKLQMGTPRTYSFADSGRTMTPEELSAEVLKSLRADVEERTGERISAAVITVPAAFELPQCEATKRAAQIAGFHFSTLLQEPVAAALAYGFQSSSDRVYWLVYDLGGGTFDAAIVQVREGGIPVVNHGGDNYLGGKLIDWEIVERIFVPALKKEYAFSSFERGDPKWRAAFGKLKQAAEEAKIRLSRDTVALVSKDPLCQDERGEWVRFEYELKRSEIEPFIEPLVERSLNICGRVMAEKGLGSGDIEKVLLVGGPTRTPLLREMLSHRLGIPLEFKVDPLTVVARGAAIFAGTQRLERLEVVVPPGPTRQYAIDLEYKPIHNDPEPFIGGKVKAPEGGTLSGFTIEFIESKNQWRSGRIDLNSDGGFATNLKAEQGRRNEFIIELRDKEGNRCEIVPDRIQYTVGLVFDNPPLTHSIGVEMANNEVDPFLAKGTPLPARKRSIHRTVNQVRRGESGTFIRIPVVEGESRRAGRNRLIGYLEVRGSEVRRDVPAGSDVEITIEIDESRLVQTKAYIPILNEEYKDVLTLEKPEMNPQQLREEVQKEKRRLAEAQGKIGEIGESQAEEVVQRIERERMVQEIESSLAAAQGGDSEAIGQCQARLLDLRNAVDQIEGLVEWPELKAKAWEVVVRVRDVVGNYGDEGEKRLFQSLEREIDASIESRDQDLLRQKIDEMHRLEFRVLDRRIEFWILWLHYLTEQKVRMKDRELADRLIAQGNSAISSNDIDRLKAAVRQLRGLLPDEPPPGKVGYGGTTIRAW